LDEKGGNDRKRRRRMDAVDVTDQTVCARACMSGCRDKSDGVDIGNNRPMTMQTGNEWREKEHFVTSDD
jgi:hypothetical protein